MANVTSAGYKTLLSTPWYLNLISYGQDWQVQYKADPQDFAGVSPSPNTAAATLTTFANHAARLLW